MRPKKLFKLLLSILFVVSANSVSAVSPCDLSLMALKERVAQTYPSTWSVLHRLEEFSKKNKLPTKLLNLGPEEREVPRLFVGLDISNPKLVQEYLDTFHLEGKLDDKAAGVLALEFQLEHEGNYVTGVLRPKSGLKDKIYRWGREDLPRNEWWDDWLISSLATPKKTLFMVTLI